MNLTLENKNMFKSTLIRLLGGYTPKEVEQVAIETAQYYTYKPAQVKGFLSHIEENDNKYNL